MSIAAALSLALACQRRAPGPEECQTFAAAALGLNDASLLQMPAVKDVFDRLVIDCLTRPYDRELVRCTQERSTPGLVQRQLRFTPGAQSCWREFMRRRAELEPAPSGETRQLPWVSQEP